MNRLSTDKRAAVIGALCEGNSMRATCRMTGVAKGTVTKLLVDIGWACLDKHDELVRGIHSRSVQCDEIWTYVYARKQKVPESKVLDPNVGDIWTWNALCADSKLLISYHVGGRDSDDAELFMGDLKLRLATPCQITTDGHQAYKNGITRTFGLNVDWARCVKLYGKEKSHRPGSPNAEVVGVERSRGLGAPDMSIASTSYVERSNLTLRTHQRRFTRSTNAFSKKIDNLRHAVALHAIYYNFARKHQTLKGQTPAMAAGLAERPWTFRDIAVLLDSN